MSTVSVIQRFSAPTFVLVIGLLLSACGAPAAAVPTADRFSNATTASGSSGPNAPGESAGDQRTDPNIATLAPSAPAANATMTGTANATGSSGTAGTAVAVSSASPVGGSTTVNATITNAPNNTTANTSATPCASSTANAAPTSATTSAAATPAATTTAAGAYLGAVGSTVANCGVQITSINPGTAAQIENLQVGDLITAIDQTPIRSTQDLQAALAAHNVNDRVTISIQRGGQALSIGVTLMAVPNANVSIGTPTGPAAVATAPATQAATMAATTGG